MTTWSPTASGVANLYGLETFAFSKTLPSPGFVAEAEKYRRGPAFVATQRCLRWCPALWRGQTVRRKHNLKG